MQFMHINFIGCGGLGKTIAKLIHIHKLGTITGIKNSSYKSTVNAIQFIGEGKACATFKELPPADLYFIATSDDQIQPSCEQLSHEHIFKKNTIVIHLSGSRTSDILISAKNKGCHIASFHPIKSFVNPETHLSDFKDTYCAVEGDKIAVDYITHLFQKLGAIVFTINKDQKALYHAACVIANNYLVTLHHSASKCFQESGVDKTTAEKLTSSLMQNMLNNLNNLTYQEALTGPIQRGDIKTITSHLQTLQPNELIKNIYAVLGLGTLALTKHDQEQKEILEKILQE